MLPTSYGVEVTRMYGGIYVDRPRLERRDDCILVSVIWLADEVRSNCLLDLAIKRSKTPREFGNY